MCFDNKCGGRRQSYVSVSRWLPIAQQSEASRPGEVSSAARLAINDEKKRSRSNRTFNQAGARISERNNGAASTL